MLINGKEVDLNAPAFGPEAMKADGTPKETVEPSVEEPKEEIEKESEVVEPSVEENKVPYSRFKKYHDLAKEAQEEALMWKSQAEALRQIREEKVESTNDLPDYWVEMYGDSEASKKAWGIQQRQNEQLKKEALEAAISAVREERESESARIEENVMTIDQNMEVLSEYVGRELTDKEQSALLDIVDEYTPKDDDGNYLGSILSFDKAWEIYELKNQAQSAPKKQARDSVAGLSGSKSQGETSITADKSKDFNPLDWNAWKKRVQ